MPYEVLCPACGRTTNYEYAHAEIILSCKCGEPILLDGSPAAEPASRPAAEPARCEAAAEPAPLIDLPCEPARDLPYDAAEPRLPHTDACHWCGQRHAECRCPGCEMRLCGGHKECPECEEPVAPRDRRYA